MPITPAIAKHASNPSAETTTGPVSFTQPAPVGAILVAWFGGNGTPGTLGISDSKSNTWQLVGQILNTGATKSWLNVYACQVTNAIVTTPTPDTVTATDTTSQTLLLDVDLLTAYTITQDGTPESAQSTGASPITLPAMTVAVGDIVFHGTCINDSAGTFGLGAGFSLAVQETAAVALARSLYVQYQVATTTSVTPSMTPANSKPYATFSFALKPLAVSGTLTLGGTTATNNPAAGTISLSGTVTPSTASTGSISLSGAANGAAQATATASIALTGTTGATTAAAGSITLGGTGTPSTKSSGSITLTGTAATTMAGSGTITLTGTAGQSSQATGAINLTGGSGPSFVAAGALTLTGSSTGHILITPGGAITLAGTAIGSAPATALGAITLLGQAAAAAAIRSLGAISLGGVGTGTIPRDIHLTASTIPDRWAVTARPDRWATSSVADRWTIAALEDA